jgi:hypothetical protein
VYRGRDVCGVVVVRRAFKIKIKAEKIDQPIGRGVERGLCVWW